jgi:acetoin utilization deacetylase AcuC-like enzyme
VNVLSKSHVLQVVYSSRYEIDIGPHVFPTLKYRLVHDRLVSAGIVDPSAIIDPQPASWDELALVHTREYLDAMRGGTLSSELIAQLELPWSPEMVEGFRVMVGGTITAAKLACEPEKDRVVCHLGGGLHHAFPNHGEGFCPFNDVAVAARVLQARGVERAAIVDLDVHHGNGTAFVFESDPRVFTFSMHQQHNYPMWKPRSSLDIGLPDGTGDATFLARLESGLAQSMAHRPACVFYLAGADPYQDDQLGGLNLTKEGLRRRDRLVIDAALTSGVPLVVTLAGGYARRVEDTVAIHVATIEEAKRLATKTRKHETGSS